MNRNAKYLIDTNIFSYAVNADWGKPESYPHWINRRLRTNLNRCCLPSIAVQEITFGMHRSQPTVERAARIEKLLKRLPKVVYDERAAKIAGKLRADLSKQGLPLEDADIQIAAIAIRHNLILVTHNVKHFGRIPNLRIQDWADMPMSFDKFLNDAVDYVMEPARGCAAFFLVILACSLSAKTFATDVSQGLFHFFLYVVMLCIVAGIILGLSNVAILRIGARLKQRRNTSALMRSN